MQILPPPLNASHLLRRRCGESCMLIKLIFRGCIIIKNGLISNIVHHCMWVIEFFLAVKVDFCINAISSLTKIYFYFSRFFFFKSRKILLITLQSTIYIEFSIDKCRYRKIYFHSCAIIQ